MNSYKVSTGIEIEGTEVLFDTDTRYFTWGVSKDRSGWVEPKARASTVAELRVVIDRYQERARRESEAAKLKKRLAKEPIPVSVVWAVGHPGQDGDYLLRGWHATNKTALLSTPDGKPAGFTPSGLSRVTVMEPFTEAEWDEYRNIMARLQAATNALKDAGRRPVLVVNRNSASRDFKVVFGKDRFRESETMIESFDYRVEDGLLVADVGVVRYEAGSYDELVALLLERVHPEQGQPGIIFDKKSGIIRTGEAYLDVNASHGDFYFDLTVEQAREVWSEYAQSLEQREQFLAKRTRISAGEDE